MENDKDIENLPVQFRSAYHRLRLNVLLTNCRLTESLRDFLEGYDITAQQYNILRIVQRAAKPLSILQIREQMFEKMCDASRLIDRLILKDLVTKQVAEQDKRLVEVFLTDKGKALLEDIVQKIHIVDDPLNILTEEEADTISDLLTKMRGSEKHF